ncbi:hypothetical protein J6R97_03260 [bacterium]|nr:hypothetical protein [bacterium]
MVLPVSQLANMEMALYGGFGSNANAPSYLNGYSSNNSYSNPSFYGYNNYDQTFGQNIPYSNNMNTSQTQPQNSIFQGLSQSETQALKDDYKKSLSPSEGILGAAAGGAAFALIQNPRLICHPINSWKATKATNAAFASVKGNSALNKLWNNPKYSNILREAYLQLHKAEARKMTKFGAIRRSYKATGDVEKIDNIVNNLKNALKEGKIGLITKHTAELQHAYSVNQGFIPRTWNKITKFFTGKEAATVTSKLNDKNGILNRYKTLKNTTGTSMKSILKRGGGIKGGILFFAMEILMNLGKIKTAFEKDSNTGMKQLGQTAVKGTGNAVGWALGEAASVWAFTKWGAKIGSKIHPILGTLIGGAVGVIGGTVGMCLAGKATKALVGQDVADDIDANKLAQTTEGQEELLKNTIERMQRGEKVSPEAQQAVQKIINQYYA